MRAILSGLEHDAMGRLAPARPRDGSPGEEPQHRLKGDRWRHVRYEPLLGPRVDFTWEREWRASPDGVLWRHSPSSSGSPELMLDTSNVEPVLQHDLTHSVFLGG